MISWCVIALFFSAFSFTTCNPVPCDRTEEKCLEKMSKNLYSKLSYMKIILGDPDHGTETLDPLHHDVVNGKLSILNYTLTDSITTGFKDCKVENLKLNAGLVSLQFEIVCPKFAIKGKYDIHGRLIILPVEGEGDFEITSGKYRISVSADLKISSGNKYVSIKSFKQTAEPLENLKFDFKNLFNGQKDLADAVLKFANENWYEVAKEVQEPIFAAHIKKIVKNINKYLKEIPIEDLET